MSGRPDELIALDTLLARDAPYEEMRAAIDKALAKAEGSWWLPGVAQHWSVACVRFRRPLEECREVAELLRAEEQDPVDRATSLLGLCRLHPELARELLPEVDADLARAANGLAHLRALVAAALEGDDGEAP